MPFTDFSYTQVVKAFDLHTQRVRFFDTIEPKQPSSWLVETLERGKPLAFMSEKARSEFMIAPVLLEVRSFAIDQLAIFSGQRLDIDPNRGLNGECDFIISKGEPLPVVQAPIISVVEAKRQDIELGYGQTIAQMVASQEFNIREATPMPVMYGCVSTGEAWQFMRLKNENLQIDSNRYYLNELPELLGAFKCVIREFITL
jgi:hypothetical protein